MPGFYLQTYALVIHILYTLCPSISKCAAGRYVYYYTRGSSKLHFSSNFSCFY
jgi:hypothetical protein